MSQLEGQKGCDAMLATIHDADSIMEVVRRSRHAEQGVETIEKPKMINHYNSMGKCMVQSDQLLL